MPNPPCPHCEAVTHVHRRSEHSTTYRCSDLANCGKVHTPKTVKCKKPRKPRNRWAEMTCEQKSIAIQRQRDRRANRRGLIDTEFYEYSEPEPEPIEFIDIDYNSVYSVITRRNY